VRGYKPTERFSKERYIGGSLGLRLPRDRDVTRHAGQVSEPEENARLGSGLTDLNLAPACRGAAESRSGPMHRRMNFPLGAREAKRDVLSGAAKVDPPAGEYTRREAEMSQRETEHLRVLIANERKDRLALVAPIVAALGHEVIAREIEVEDVGAVTARERPDVALVGLGESSEHALHLVEKIVHEAACPVIALIHAPDPDFVKEASKRGVFAYITDADAKDWQSSIDIVLRRFTEYHDLEGAFGRRAVTERAKGILMERHSVDEPAAFEMLREHARTTNRKLVDVASAVVDGHRLLPKQPHSPAPTHVAGG
jgi:AmiR/NasT family two-component response regulator